MDRPVTLQRERRVFVFADGGLSVTDRWHATVSLGSRRKAPLALVQATLLDAYCMAREIVQRNGLAEDTWQPAILAPVVQVVHVDAENGPRQAAKPRATTATGAHDTAPVTSAAGLLLLHGAKRAA